MENNICDLSDLLSPEELEMIYAAIPSEFMLSGNNNDNSRSEIENLLAENAENISESDMNHYGDVSFIRDNFIELNDANETEDVFINGFNDIFNCVDESNDVFSRDEWVNSINTGGAAQIVNSEVSVTIVKYFSRFFHSNVCINLRI